MALNILIAEDNDFTALQYNRILETTPNQRIIFASAYALGGENETTEVFKENVEFLQKPFSLTKLIRQVGN